ncbi:MULTISPECIES: CGNR zinc finger domain-containing protein [unclassified Rhodococcus (in: high G+C Gram-positive bacteria)]|uniref:CGNR zinc finger domain-containing protein n=1 Tax=Rhodococcus sp. 114MFTsu3.1 TaxID=1172184 RepID=UPI00047F690E|nr:MULTISPECIES: CGNR zinc finger domain-containing protein [unclassified Rhodococcus (in: high G+C Gram-positive bacteria)]
MHINPYGTYAVQLGVDLLNSPPTSADELGHRCIEGGLVLDAPATDADVTATVAFLREWEAVIDADTEQARAGILNGLLAQASAYPRLTNHAGDGWHMHYRDPDIDLGSVVRALVSVGTALHLTGRGMNRLGRCAAEDCVRVFADVSRTGRQRYCGTVCSNRDAVRRHRAKTAPA